MVLQQCYDILKHQIQIAMGDGTVEQHLGEGGGEGGLSESLEVQQVVHALPHQGLVLAVEHALVHTQQPGGMAAGPARR